MKKKNDSDVVEGLLAKAGVPINRTNYLNLAFWGKPPAVLSPEEEQELPEHLQRDSGHCSEENKVFDAQLCEPIEFLRDVARTTLYHAERNVHGGCDSGIHSVRCGLLRTRCSRNNMQKFSAALRGGRGSATESGFSSTVQNSKRSTTNVY